MVKTKWENKILNYLSQIISLISGLKDRRKTPGLDDSNHAVDQYTLIKKQLQENPADAKSWNDLGDYHYCRSEFDKAIGCFKEAVSLDPKYALAFVNLGMSYRQLNSIQESFDSLRSAFLLDPNSPWIRLQMALTYLHRGMKAGCVEDVEKAKEIVLSVAEANPNDLLAQKVLVLITHYLKFVKFEVYWNDTFLQVAQVHPVEAKPVIQKLEKTVH